MGSLEIIVGSGNSHKIREIQEILADVGQVRCVPFHELEDLPDIDENGRTFAENAALKARLLAQYLFARRGMRASGRHTAVDSEDTRSLEKLSAERARERHAGFRGAGSGRMAMVTGDKPRLRPFDVLVMADDSGIVVDSLGGQPGVHSARYSGRHGDDDANNAKLLRELEGIPTERRTARFVCAMSLATPTGVLFTVEGKVEGKIAKACEGRSGFGYDPLFYYPPFDKTFGQIEAAQKNRVSHRAEALKQFRERLLKLLASEGIG
jgi:non-canonical purine NTP pyrophosphatase (RdgB/HAM1 family)